MIILSIDAWGNEVDGYTWNAWYRVGNIDKAGFEALHTDKDYIQWFIDNDYVSDCPDSLEILDDQYNIVIYDKETGEPFYAIEYGCEY